MSKRMLSAVVVTLGLLASVAGGARAQGPCQFVAGPPVPTAFTTDPQTGLIAFDVPMAIDGHSYTVHLEIAFLGNLVLSDVGLPLRAVSSHRWRFEENGLQLEWFAETFGSATADPFVMHFASRLDLAQANKRYERGLAFVEGEINLLDFSGQARGIFGRLCRKP
jgi:hypothetical protein